MLLKEQVTWGIGSSPELVSSLCSTRSQYRGAPHVGLMGTWSSLHGGLRAQAVHLF